MALGLPSTPCHDRLLALLDDVAAGDEVEITKHGRTVARLVPATRPHAVKVGLVGVATTSREDADLLATGIAWKRS